MKHEAKDIKQIYATKCDTQTVRHSTKVQKSNKIVKEQRNRGEIGVRGSVVKKKEEQ